MAKGSFGRLANIWRSNVNDFLDRMEDPEKMVRQVVRDMEAAVDRAVEGLSRAVANQRRLEKQEAHTRAEIERWQKKAEQAVGEGDEEYARLALAKKADLCRVAEALKPAVEESRETAARLRLQVEEMRRRLQEARTKQENLISRYQVSRRSQEGQSEPAGSENDPFIRFQRIERQVQTHEEDLARCERKVDEVAAEADLYREMAQAKKEERELQRIEREKRVEEELATLRDKVNRSA